MKKLTPRKNGYTSNDVDEVLDLFSNWCLSTVQTGGKSGYTTHDSTVTSVDDNPSGSTYWIL